MDSKVYLKLQRLNKRQLITVISSLSGAYQASKESFYATMSTTRENASVLAERDVESLLNDLSKDVKS